MTFLSSPAGGKPAKPANVVNFNTPGAGSWTVPAGVTSVRASLWGAGGGSGGASNDPNFSNVALLLHADGSNGSTTLVDSSASGVAFTAYGNAQLSTAQKKFGSASMAFDGNGDYFQTSVDSSSLWSLGTGDFTVEGWVYFISQPQGWAEFVCFRTGTSGATSADADSFAIDGGKASVYIKYGGASTSIGDNSSLPANAWTHLAFTRSSGTIRLFVNGVLSGSSATFTANMTANKLVFGTDGFGTSGTLNGYIDEVRITKGLARYTANFTPPSAPFPNVAGGIAGSGGGGAFASSLLATTPGSSLSFNIGSGGSPGFTSGGTYTAGTAGGSTTLGAITAGGGGGGGSGTNGAGGTASGGDINISGYAGNTSSGYGGGTYNGGSYQKSTASPNGLAPGGGALGGTADSVGIGANGAVQISY